MSALLLQCMCLTTGFGVLASSHTAERCVVESRYGPKEAEGEIPAEFHDNPFERQRGIDLPYASGSAIGTTSWPSYSGDAVRHELMDALNRGDVEAVRHWLAAHPGILVDPPDDFTRTAVGWAVYRGDLEIVKQLVLAGAPLRDRPDRYGAPKLVAVLSALGGLNAKLEAAREPAARERVASRFMALIRYLIASGAPVDPPAGSPLPALARLAAFPQRRDLIGLVVGEGVAYREPDLSVGLRAAARNLNADWMELVDTRAGSEPAKNAALLAFLISGREDLATRLVREGANIHTAYPVGNRGYAPLIAAVTTLRERARQRAVIDFYRREGGDFDLPMLGDGTTALMRALPDPDVVSMLLDAGANPDRRDNAGRTALNAALDLDRVRPEDLNEPAAWRKSDPGRRLDTRLANVRLLVSHGADPNALFRGATPLMQALPIENQVVDLLVQAGGDVRSGSDAFSARFGAAGPFLGPVSWATLKGHRALPLSLLRRDGYDRERDCGAAYYAAVFDRTELMDALAQANARLGVTDDHGDNPYWAAIAHDSVGVVAWMLDHGMGAVGDARKVGMSITRDGQTFEGGTTVLMYAAQSGAVKVARLLLERGARPEVRDALRRTASDYAIAAGHLEIAAVLGSAASAGNAGRAIR